MTINGCVRPKVIIIATIIYLIALVIKKNNSNIGSTTFVSPSFYEVYNGYREVNEKEPRLFRMNENKVANIHPDDLHTRCFGGGGGVPFDDGNQNGRITRISIRCDNTINQLSITYALGKITRTCHHGGVGGPGVKTHVLDLHIGEYVTEVHVVCDCSRVLQLLFKTEFGRILGPCGRENCNQDGGSAWSELVAAPEGHVLVGVRGMAGTMLDCIGFYWGIAPAWRRNYHHLSSSCLMDLEVFETEDSDDEQIQSSS